MVIDHCKEFQKLIFLVSYHGLFVLSANRFDPNPLVDSYLSKHSVMIKAPVDRWAKFPHSPILHYAYSLLLEENNSANNRLPLGLSALFSRS